MEEGGLLAIGVSTVNVAPGTSLYWRFSGAGITASDFGDGQLLGASLIGVDGRAAFSKLIAADALIDPDESLELRFSSDPAGERQLGSTLTVLLKEPSVGVSSDGSDILTGSTATDLLSGVPAGSALRGRGALDRLTGGGGPDLFVLGDARGLFYDDGTVGLGSVDLAVITDFSADDRIQLHGRAADYRLVSGCLGGLAGLRVDAMVAGAPEAIGFVLGATPTTLSLADASRWLFVA